MGHFGRDYRYNQGSTRGNSVTLTDDKEESEEEWETKQSRCLQRV